MKNTKGITLIALVVTIVVLIILAGVSINLLLGQNGIITRAQSAKELTQGTQANEQVALGQIANQIEGILSGGNDEPDTGHPGGEYDDPYIPVGFKHTEGTWNSGYVIKETATGNEFVWVPCVINQSEVKAGDTVVTFGKTLPTTTADTDSLYKYNQYNYELLPETTSTTINEEDETVAKIRTSVGQYEGFYIARYEAGIEGTQENYFHEYDEKCPTDGSVKPLSQSGKGVWNEISRIASLAVSKTMVNTIDGVKSTLISGECWDTTLQWMVNASDNKAINAGYDINSKGKGWYEDVSLQEEIIEEEVITNYVRHLTGYYSVNNIYDMAGNVVEWTTENCDNFWVIARGGKYDNNGEEYPAAHRADGIDYYSGVLEDCDTGFRPVLYK